MFGYHVAESNSYLVVTGIGIEKVLIKKKVCSSNPALSKDPKFK
jgi:hypothetical protein